MNYRTKYGHVPSVSSLQRVNQFSMHVHCTIKIINLQVFSLFLVYVSRNLRSFSRTAFQSSECWGQRVQEWLRSYIIVQHGAASPRRNWSCHPQLSWKRENFLALCYLSNCLENNGLCKKNSFLNILFLIVKIMFILLSSFWCQCSERKLTKLKS